MFFTRFGNQVRGGGGGGAPKGLVHNLLMQIFHPGQLKNGRGMGRALMQLMHFFSHFCYVGGFGDLGDSVVSTLRGVSGDVVTVSAS